MQYAHLALQIAAVINPESILRAHAQTTEAVRALADLYDAWDAAEPGKGYDAKASEWRAKIPDIEPDAASP